jgi:hypothetical protein
MRAWANSGRRASSGSAQQSRPGPVSIASSMRSSKARCGMQAGRQTIFRCGCRFRTFGMTIAIQCFSRSAQPDCRTADTGLHRERESMLSSSAADSQPCDDGVASARGSRGRARRPFGRRRGPIHRRRSWRSAGSGIARNMPGVPRSTRENRKGENDCNNDDRQRSAVDRAVPVLSIAHAVLLSDCQQTPLSA